MTPGPIALNAATFVGIKVGGLLGAVIATFGSVFPTTVIVIVIGHHYYKYREMMMIQEIFRGLRPAVVASIASAGISILLLDLFNTETLSNLFGIDWKAIVIFIVGLIILRKFKPNPIYVMLGSGVVGVLVYLLL